MASTGVRLARQCLHRHVAACPLPISSTAACLSVLQTLVWMSFRFRMKTRGRSWLAPYKAAGRRYHTTQSSPISQVGQEHGVDE